MLRARMIVALSLFSNVRGLHWKTKMFDDFFQNSCKTHNLVTVWDIFMQIYRNVKLYQVKVSKGAKIRNRCNRVSHLTQDTNGKVTNSQLDTTNESQEVSPFPAGNHKA